MTRHTRVLPRRAIPGDLTETSENLRAVSSVADSVIEGLNLFEILFLGTSASAPSAKRGLSAQIVKHDEYRFLIDCGEGTQRQILQSGVGFKNLTRILLTHGHLDHILGLGGLLSTLLRWESADELDIFGGRATLDRVHDLLYGVVLRSNVPPMPLRLNEIKPGTFFEADDFTVTAFTVSHRGPDCLGYVFEGKARRPFLPDRPDALGVPFGPVRRDLVAGKEITLPDGITRPYSVWLSGVYPRPLDGLCKILSLDMRVLDPAWVGMKLMLEYLHTAGYIHFEVPRMAALGVILVIFAVSLVWARMAGPVETDPLTRETEQILAKERQDR